jgi:hypothetical protein
MALIINGIERQTVSIGGTEFKNLGGGGVKAHPWSGSKTPMKK